MTAPRILVFAGSTRKGSFNASLAFAAEREISRAGAEVTSLSLADHPLPIYNQDFQAEQGIPQAAIALKRRIGEHDGVFIASPEYNAGYTPLLKNALDWVSRVREGDEAPLAVFRSRVFALGSASNSPFGGLRSLISLRQVMELGLGALVIPEVVVVSAAADAFAEDGSLKPERPAAALKVLAQRLVALARQMAAQRTA